MLKLRPYQQNAVDKLIWSMGMPGADLVVLPTGAGKSLVIAEFAKRLGSPVLILQPSKEILEQNVAKMLMYVGPKEIGIYSASVGRKDINTYTFATIQSIYKKPKEFEHFKFVIIDECHLVNHKNLDGMFTKFLNAVGNPKVVGLTATPYRMDQSYNRESDGTLTAFTTTKLINRMGRQRFWHRIVCCVNLKDLIREGYLAPLEYIDKSIIKHEDIPKNISLSDFNLAAFEEKIEKDQDKIIHAIGYATGIAQHVLVFCSSVKQAAQLQEIFAEDGAAVVTAETSKKDRDDIINKFRSGAIQTVFNVGVLTTGFDFPELDCIVLLRPTRSIGLYYQMLGRGVRRAEGKKACKVIDLTSTVKELGRIETIKLIKQEGWELVSEKGYWHNQVLYSFKVNL